jgi:proline racemase
MKLLNSIFVVDSHTAGQPTRIVVGGLPKIPGDSIVQKKDYLIKEMGYLGRFLCDEPRGHHAMFAAILTEPCVKTADFGVIFCWHGGFPDMCGHGTIGVASMLIEMGMVDVKTPTTSLTLETPAGLIGVTAEVVSGKAKSVTFVNVPSFLYKEDVTIDVPGYGKLKGDVAFGGNWFFYVNGEEIGLRVKSENIGELVKAGAAIKAEFNKKFDMVHPKDSNVSKKISGVYLVDSNVTNKKAREINLTVLGRFFDRSPCGAGTCARMAILHSKNKLGLNEDFINESIIGTTFRGRAIEKTKVGDYSAVVPQITASACISGFNHLVLDVDDPFGASGFYVGEKLSS